MKLINGATAVSTGNIVPVQTGNRTFQATVTGTGAVTATVSVEVSNDGKNFLNLATIDLSGTGSNTDGFASDAVWEYVRGRVTAISGTNATVDLIMGVL